LGSPVNFPNLRKPEEISTVGNFKYDECVEMKSLAAHPHAASDSELIERLPVCNEEEKKEIFLTLYDRYKNMVLKCCYHYLGDYELANDLFHDIFVKILQKAQAIKNPALFKSWLMTIARNSCVDYLRKTSYLKNEFPLTVELEVALDTRVEDKIIAEMDKDKILNHLSACIQRLDGFQLSVFKLRWQGLKAAQISKILKTDKAQLRRSYDNIQRTVVDCMEKKGFTISMDRIITLGEMDE
jgi:RNA polymerase sigma-70 factor, ECF subfamily